MKKFFLGMLCMISVFATCLAGNQVKADHKDLGKVIVTGHMNPDCDAVCGAVAAADLLAQKGYDTQPMVAGHTDAETEFVLEKFGVEKPERLENASGKNLFFVAHAAYHDAVKGADKARLRGIIDNYNLTGLNVVEPIIIVSRPYGSTCTLINQICDFEKIKVSKQMAGLMLAGIISETINLKADITTNLDRETVAKLAKRAGVKNVNKFAQEMFAAGWSWNGWSDKAILEDDLRSYPWKSGPVYFAKIGCTNGEIVAEMRERMNFYVPKYMRENNIDALFVALLDMEKVTMELLPYGEGAAKVAAKAFKKYESNGRLVMQAGKISRRRDIIPALMEAVVGEWNIKRM